MKSASLLLLLSLLAAITIATIVVVAVSAHECAHDQMKNNPGYGIHSPVVQQRYDHHTDELVNSYHKFDDESSRKEKEEAVRQRRIVPDKYKRRVADALVANPAATLGDMRMTTTFDAAACPGTDCGHCVSVGQSVRTFESSPTHATCVTEDVLTTAKKNYIMNRLMPKAIAFLGKALRINPVVGPLIIGSGTCGSPGTPVPASHASPGVSSSDFQIYVTAAPKSDTTSGTVAWALKCRVDGSNRPIAAHVNWIPRKLTNAVALDPIKEQSDVATAIHEISHALSFSSPFFDGTNTYYDLSRVAQSGGVTTVASSAPFNKARKFISSTRVVNEVKSYFGCNTATGAEIEDDGGAGTADSHWEKRVFQSHVMSGISSTVVAMPSKLLLAYFEDTGHYIANYDVVNSTSGIYNVYGRGKGCAYLDQKCDSATNKASGEYCFVNDNKKQFCTYDGLGKGYCPVQKYSSSLPSNKQYFTDSTLGSSIQLDDYCPSPGHYSNQRCGDTSAQATAGGGEAFGDTSRCFQSNLLKSGSGLLGSSSSSSSAGVATERTRCYDVVCDGDRMHVIVDLKMLPCPASGAAGDADISGLSGFTGKVICPPARRFCPAIINGTGGQVKPPAITSAVAANPPKWAASYAGAVYASCASRRSMCAEKVRGLLPQCRRFAFEVARCFGTDCDSDMASWLISIGANHNCSAGRAAFTTYCQEGTKGVSDICGLASAGQLIWSAALSLISMCLLAVLVL